MANFCAKRVILANLNRIRLFEKQKVLSSCSILNFHCCTNNGVNYPQLDIPQKYCTWKTFDYAPARFYSSSEEKPAKPCPEKKPGLFQRFKDMYKKYWYVLVPVHIVTSTFWFAGFYYLAKSGVDIVSILESINMSETIIRPLRDSSMGYIAVAYALYKIATPARYAVTLGGTTVSINYLKKWGYIKPVPSTEQLRALYREKRQEFMYKTDSTRNNKVLDEFGKKLKNTKEQIDKNETRIDLQKSQETMIYKNKDVKKTFYKDKD